MKLPVYTTHTYRSSAAGDIDSFASAQRSIGPLGLDLTAFKMFGGGGDHLHMTLDRAQVTAFRNMLNEILEDWK